MREKDSYSRVSVYNALYKIGPTTASVIAKYLNFRVKGSVCARLSELRNLGMAKELGKKVCSISKVKVILWDVTTKRKKYE